MIMWMNTMSGDFAFAFYVMYREKAKNICCRAKYPCGIYKKKLSKPIGTVLSLN